MNIEYKSESEVEGIQFTLLEFDDLILGTDSEASDVIVSSINPDGQVAVFGSSVVAFGLGAADDEFTSNYWVPLLSIEFACLPSDMSVEIDNNTVMMTNLGAEELELVNTYAIVLPGSSVGYHDDQCEGVSFSMPFGQAEFSSV